MKKIHYAIFKCKRAASLVLAAVALAAVPATSMARTQDDEKGVRFNIAGDLVSSYVWRGQYQTGASFQPTLGIAAGGFSLTAWGSVDITGKEKKEVDLTAAYSFKGFTVSVADLWWPGEGKGNYFHLGDGTDHILEAGLSYTLPFEKFPLSLSWYTMLAGADKTADGDRAYSTYIEANYPFRVKTVDLNVFCGISPWESGAGVYGNSSFAVTNIGLKAAKAIRINEHFSLPLYTSVMWNPNKEDVHLVLGLTFRP